MAPYGFGEGVGESKLVGVRECGIWVGPVAPKYWFSCGSDGENGTEDLCLTDKVFPSEMIGENVAAGTIVVQDGGRLQASEAVKGE